GAVTSPTDFTVTLGITALSTSSGAVGDPVTIGGVGLDTVTGLTFNGTPAAIDTQSAAQITTHVPAGASTRQITATDGTHPGHRRTAHRLQRGHIHRRRRRDSMTITPGPRAGPTHTRCSGAVPLKSNGSHSERRE